MRGVRIIALMSAQGRGQRPRKRRVADIRPDYRMTLRIFFNVRDGQGERKAASSLVVTIATAINARRSHMDNYLLLIFTARAFNYLQRHIGNTKTSNMHN